MKGKFLVLLLSAVFSMSVYAEWKEVDRFTTVDSGDADVIGNYLGYLPELQQQLLGIELSRPDKIVVSHLMVAYTSMQWENDEFCQVEDPTSVGNQYLTKIEFDSYWAANPSVIEHGTLHQFSLVISPCGLIPMPFPFPDTDTTDTGPIPLPSNMVKTTFTFNNHVKTL